MRLFVFDVDGTLVTWTGRFRNRTISAMNKILDHGDAIAIASGRPFIGITKFLDKLHDGKKFVIAANGAATYDIKGNVLDFCALKYKDFVDFYNKYNYLMDRSKASIYGYSLKEVIYFRMTPNTKMESICNNNIRLRNLNKEPLKNDDTLLKIMIAVPSKNIKDIEFLEEKEKYNFVDSSDLYHEFINKETDKSRGVEALRKYLKIEKKDCYCFGDNMNDFFMIKNYHGVAMGNAVKDVKNVAKEITLSVKEDGVAAYLEKFKF